VLLVGAIHNERELFTNEIKVLEVETRDWYDRKISNRKYLNSVRNAYEKSADRWSNKAVWSGFGIIRAELGLQFKQTAFTNLAKCYLPAGAAGGTERSLRACLGQNPLQRLCTALDPQWILVAQTSEKTRPVLRRLNNDNCRIWQYENTFNRRKWDETNRRFIPWDEWFPEVIEAYTALRGPEKRPRVKHRR
jgi:hypothetical protein